MGEHNALNNQYNVRMMLLLDILLLMFSPEHLVNTVELINRNLMKQGNKESTTGEIVELFGAIVLGTRYEFDNRQDLRVTV